MSAKAGSGAPEAGLRRKISMVRDALLDMNINGGRAYSKDDVSIALQFYDLDVDRTVQAFLEDGAIEALGEWNKPTRAANRSSAAASGGVQTQNGEHDGSGTSKKKKRKNKQSTNGDVKTDVSASSSAVDCHSIGGELDADKTAQVKEDGLAGTDGGNTNVDRSSESLDTSQSSAALSAGEHFILAVLNANIGENKDAQVHEVATEPQPERPLKQRQRNTRRSETSRQPQQKSDAIEEADTPSEPTRHASGGSSTGNSQRLRATSPTATSGALYDSLSRAERELTRFVLEFERRRSKCNRDLDSTAARIERQFKAASDRLEKRRAAIVAEFAATRSSIDQYLEARSCVAASLRERIVRLQSSSSLQVLNDSAGRQRDAEASIDAQVEAVRTDVRSLSTTISRRIDEAAFGLVRFEFDDAALAEAIDRFGNVVPFNPVRAGVVANGPSSTAGSLDAATTVSNGGSTSNSGKQQQQQQSDSNGHDVAGEAEVETEFEESSIATEHELEHASSGTAETDREVFFEVSRGRRSQDNRRANEMRRSMTYHVGSAANGNGAPAATDDHWKASRHWQGSASKAPEYVGDASGNRRRFNGELAASFNVAYEPASRTAGTLRHSQSHPTYVDPDYYASSANRYWAANDYSNGNYSKRNYRNSEYAGNGYTSNHSHPSEFGGTSSRYSYYQNGTTQLGYAGGLPNRFEHFEQQSIGRQKHEFDSYGHSPSAFAHPRERDREFRFSGPRNGNRGPMRGTGSPHSAAAKSVTPISPSRHHNSSTCGSSKSNDAVGEAVTETGGDSEAQPVIEQPAVIDWVNAVEQDEQARRHDSLVDEVIDASSS